MGIQMLSDLGVGPVIVRSPRGSDERFLNTAWTLSILRGFVLWVAAAGLSWPIAAWVFQKPEVAALLAVCAVTAATRGACAISVYTFDRELRQKRSAMLELVPQFIGFAATLSWAIRSPSVWALVGGAMVGEFSRLVLSYVLSNHRHRLAWDREAVGEIWASGKWIFLSSGIGFFGSAVDRILLGRFLAEGTLGVFSMAFNLVTIPSQIILMLGWKVLFPAMAVKEREGDASEAHRRIKHALTYLGGVGAIGMIVAGPALVVILYPPRFHDAGWMLRIVSLGIWAQILDIMCYAAVMAKGQIRWTAASMLARLVAISALMPLGYWLYGVPGALAAIPVGDAAKYFVTAWGAERSGIRAFRDDAGPSLLLAALAGGNRCSNHGPGALPRGWRRGWRAACGCSCDATMPTPCWIACSPVVAFAGWNTVRGGRHSENTRRTRRGSATTSRWTVDKNGRSAGVPCPPRTRLGRGRSVNFLAWNSTSTPIFWCRSLCSGGSRSWCCCS
jgi:O-antigen/teichoic acid export membrane protein